MFNRNDYIGYFEQILKLEKFMYKDSQYLLHFFPKNPEVRKLLKEIHIDEFRHMKVIEIILDLLKG